MDFLLTLKVSIKTLFRNKMRTFLTMLGIIIGVGSVIGMVAIATGAKQKMSDQIESSGTNMITIFATSGSRRGGMHFGWGSVQTMTPADADAIMENCKHVEYASPEIRVTSRLIYKNQNWSTAVRAGNEHYIDIRNWKVDLGRNYTKDEVISRAKVCLLGNEVKEQLFGSENPIGQVIRVDKIPFRVIGLLESKGQEGFGGNWDDCIIIPHTTAMQRIYKKTYVPRLTASALSREDITKATEEITDLLRFRHKIRNPEDDDFSIRTQEDRLENANQTSQFLTIFLGSVAGVSLLVGGIGIMNIMLVSVTERIREIGIRMALGARRKDILLQFITESIVLSLSGGFIGILLGYLLAWGISKIAGWPTMVSLQSVIVSVIFSMAIGLFFGLYPAWKASSLNPIEALRHE